MHLKGVFNKFLYSIKSINSVILRTSCTGFHGIDYSEVKSISRPINSNAGGLEVFLHIDDVDVYLVHCV